LIDKRGRNFAQYDKKSKKYRDYRVVLFSFPFIVLSAIILGVLLGLLSFYFLMYLETRRGTVLLPNYIGKDVQIAEKELINMGFRIEKIGDSGKVINMDPPANTVVKKGRKVKLFAQNLVEKSISLPDFTGTWYKSVQNILRLFDIDTVTKTVEDARINGTVVQTSPTPGNTVRSGDTVTLFVSNGSGRAVGNTESFNESSGNTTDFSETGSSVETIPPEVSVEGDNSKPTLDILSKPASPSNNESNGTKQDNFGSENSSGSQDNQNNVSQEYDSTNQKKPNVPEEQGGQF